MTEDLKAYQTVKALQRLKTELLGEIPSDSELSVYGKPDTMLEIYKVISWKHPTKGWMRD